MFSYFDPITLEDLEMNNDTVLYLVRLHVNKDNAEQNTYGIKALSCKLEQCANEPHTRATEYWHIDTTALLARVEEKAQLKCIIFADDKLTTNPIKHTEILEYLGFDPKITPPTRFNRRSEQQNHVFFQPGPDDSPELEELSQNLLQMAMADRTLMHIL